MLVGLYFGSFNPLHIGHMALANYIVENTDLDQILFIVSPQNPHKNKKTLLDENLRYDMVYETIKDDPRFKVSNIEFSMPKPSYTSDTLVVLEERFPNDEFCLIMGEDNLLNLHKWKNYEFITNNYPIYVYPREHEMELPKIKANIHILKAPKIQISSSAIRKGVQNNQNLSWLVPAKVWELMDKNNYYRT